MDLLIAGAGPTGLAAALFCSRHGLEVRIVERRLELPPFSKAFGVNPRTLDLLGDVGVAEHFLDNGRKMHGLRVWIGGREVIHNDLSSVSHPRPYMLVQSQADSERIMAEALESRGVRVERGVRVGEVRLDGERVVVELEGACEERVFPPILFAADGARSSIREGLGVRFEGHDAPEPWTLYDVELDETELQQDDAHMHLLDDGVVFMVRIRERTWRALGNIPDLLERLPGGSVPAGVEWHSEFDLSARVAQTLDVRGRVFFGGDAAHIHPGLGARGMNLGIEDAWVFADRFAAGRLDEYSRERREIIVPLVSRIEGMTEIARGHSLKGRSVRRIMPILGPLLFPLVSAQLKRFVLGLDHDVHSLLE